MSGKDSSSDQYIAYWRFMVAVYAVLACLSLLWAASELPLYDKYVHRRMEDPVLRAAQDAYAFLAQGRMEEGLFELKRVADMRPNDPVSWFKVGDTFDRMGDHLQALRHYHRSLELAPRFGLAHHRTSEMLLHAVEGHFRLNADLIVSQQQLMNNVHSAWNVIAPPPAAELVNGTVSISDILFTALWHSQVAQSLIGDDARLLTTIGSIFLHMGKIDKAEESFEKAIQLDPTFSRAHVNYANLLLEKGIVSPALAHATAALSLQMPDDERRRALLIAARCHLIRHQPAAAMSKYEEIVSRNASDEVAVSGLAELYVSLGKLVEAERVLRNGLERAEQSSPHHIHVFSYNLAVVLDRLGRYKDALEAYFVALLARPAFFEPIFNIGVILQMKYGEFAAGGKAARSDGTVLRATVSQYVHELQAYRLPSDTAILDAPLYPALLHLRRAVSVLPEDQELLLRRGFIASLLGSDTEAASALRSAANNGHIFALPVLSTLLRIHGDDKESEVVLGRFRSSMRRPSTTTASLAASANALVVPSWDDVPSQVIKTAISRQESFALPTYILPRDRRALADDLMHDRTLRNAMWTVRNGRNARLAEDVLQDVGPTDHVMVQKVIPDPLLVSGHKFFLRVFIIVTASAPFRAHLHGEAIALVCGRRRQGNEKDALAEICSLAAMPQLNAGPTMWRATGMLAPRLVAEGVNYESLWSQAVHVAHRVAVLSRPEVESAAERLVPRRERRIPMPHVVSVDIQFDTQGRGYLLDVDAFPSLMDNGDDVAAFVYRRIVRDTWKMATRTETATVIKRETEKLIHALADAGTTLCSLIDRGRTAHPCTDDATFENLLIAQLERRRAAGRVTALYPDLAALGGAGERAA